MAPLLPNSTARMFYDYITADSAAGGVEHTLMVRFVGTEAQYPDVHQEVTDLFTAIGAARFQSGWKFLRARVSAVDSNISLPTVLPPGLATFVGNAGDNPRYFEAVEATFQGRSPTTGRRVDISLYGMAGISTNDFYRVQVGNANYAWLGPAVAALNAATIGFRAIGGSEASWYPYLNLNFNSYWERRLRAGA